MSDGKSQKKIGANDERRYIGDNDVEMLLDTCSSIHKVEVEIYVELDDVQAGGFNLLMFIPIRMGCYSKSKIMFYLG